MLYNSQVRSLMEYSPLVWSSCPPSYLHLLDKVQDRAHRLVENKRQEHNTPIIFQSLQHRRDVSGLCVFFKIHKLKSNHLASLRLPASTSTHHTRRAYLTGNELLIPFARTEQYMRSFHPRYSRLWNLLMQDINMSQIQSMQSFKKAAHEWRLVNSHIL